MAYMRLLVSNLCNFSCKYCHVFKLTKNESPLKVMDFETMDFSIKSFIEILKRYGDTSLILSLYGGEPLINKKNLSKAIEKYGREYDGVKIDYILNTNGSLLTEEIADFFKKYDLDLHISVDGKKEIHDQNRVDKFNKGTFDRVESALQLIKERKVKAQINSFVFPENINNLCDIVDIAKKFGIPRIYLDLFYDTQGRWLSSDIVSKKYFEAYKYGLQNDVHIGGPWSLIFIRHSKISHPVMNAPKIKVNVEGKFFFGIDPCMEHLSPPENLNYEDFTKIFKIVQNKFYILISENCKYCFLRKSCNGSMINQFMYHTRLNKGWKRSCESAKEIIKLIKNS